MSARWRSLVALLGGVLLAACTSPHSLDAATDGDATATDAADIADDASCDDFNGAWYLTGWTCNGRPEAVCIAQEGCHATEYDFLNPSAHDGIARGSTLDIHGCSFRRVDEFTATVSCIDPESSERCAATATLATPQDRRATRVCCDPVAHPCGSDERCTESIVTTGQVTFPVSACLPAGPRREGERCMYMNPDGGTDEYCAPGLECGVDGCSPLCDAHGVGCEDPQSCFQFIAVPLIGLCAPRCNLLGNDCPADQTCRIFTQLLPDPSSQPPYGLCGPIAEVPTPIGGECENERSCPADSGCFLQGPMNTPGHCLPLCHVGTADCPVGYTCVTLVSPPVRGVGFCAPNH